MWCEDPKKVPRKFRPKDVHGADIRKQGSRTESAGKQESEGRGETEGDTGASQDATKVCVSLCKQYMPLIGSVNVCAETMNW